MTQANDSQRLDASSPPPAMSLPRACLKAMRPSHWVKNLFLFVALPFSANLGNARAWAMAAAAFAGFCLLSSCIYVINDIADRDSDRRHPVKRNRPIASGQLGLGGAIALAMACLAGGAALIALVSSRLVAGGSAQSGYALAAWATLYVVLTLLYSLGLKQRPILDVLIVALGFVLRAMAGASAVSAIISPWLVVCTLMLCLFIAVAKRRSELVTLGTEDAGKTRRVHRFYTQANLEHMLSVSAGLAIVTYSLYCLAPMTVQHVGSAHLIWTIPLVVYGMFRYYCLTLNASGEDPARLLVHDKVMWIVGASWVLAVVAVIKWGCYPPIRDLLLR